MKTKILVDAHLLEDKEVVEAAKNYTLNVTGIDPEGVLMNIKHWESSIHMAFNDTLWDMAPTIIHTPEFKSRLLKKLEGPKK